MHSLRDNCHVSALLPLATEREKMVMSQRATLCVPLPRPLPTGGQGELDGHLSYTYSPKSLIPDFQLPSKGICFGT